jgi:hypothetical protein
MGFVADGGHNGFRLWRVGARAFIERRASQRAAARWRALLQSAVAARAQQARLAFFYRAPWQPGHSRRAGASAERLRLAQQQPEHNSLGLTSASAFGPFLGQSGRAARRVARAPLRTA